LNKIYKVIIVGGGASGLLCATELISGNNAVVGEEVLILERNDRIGKKLIATGNGQGNLGNANLKEENYYGDKSFIKVFLEKAKEIDLDEYFYSLGIPIYTSQDGKKYPLSKQANSVLDTLRTYLGGKNVNIVTGSFVNSVTKKDGLFSVKSQTGTYTAENLVLAVGGASGASFGTDGSSYCLAQGFGHKKTKLYPSLVQIKTQTDMVRSLKGLKEQVVITAYDNFVPLKTATGELLFTDYGISGNAVFQISGHLAKATDPSVKIEFLPDFTEREIEKLIADRQANAPFVDRIDILNGILCKRVGQAIVKTVKDFSPSNLAKALKNFRLKVTGNLGFNNSQVTKGGIATDKVNPYTFESELSNRTYILGEQLDIDGDCGGYNLTFAFVSGILSARAIKNI